MNKNLIVASAAWLLAMSWGAQAHISTEHSPTKTRQVIDRHMANLKSLFPSLQGTAVDPKTGIVVLTVYALPDARSKVLARQPGAEDLLGTPVRIDTISAPLRQP